MWTPAIVQLKSGIAIVVELKFGLPKQVLHVFVFISNQVAKGLTLKWSKC